MNITIIKKNGEHEVFDAAKILVAVRKSAVRAGVTFSIEQEEAIINHVISAFPNMVPAATQFEVYVVHELVEQALDLVEPSVALAYRNYRQHRKTMSNIMDDIWAKTNTMLYRGDKENSNADSTLTSTKGSLVRGYLMSEFYNRYFLTPEECAAIKTGFIYIHDKRDRLLYSMNCCLADVKTIITNGFEMANMWYTEPKTLDTACDVLGDIIISMSAQQYGGFTVPEVDTLLAPYCVKSFNKHYQDILDTMAMLDTADIPVDKVTDKAYNKVRRELEQGIQGLEVKLNTVASSRGDYPFVSFSFGAYDHLPKTSLERQMAKLVCSVILETRRKGQGKPGFKKPVLFPKLNFFYIEDLHGEGKEDEALFKEAIECSAAAMYPDYISLTGEGYIPEMYKKYKKPLSLMGCRASLSPWYTEGGMTPAHEDDEPIFVGRFNVGAVSLHLPLIYMQAKQDGVPFYALLDHYLDMIRQLHIRTYHHIAQMKASVNPLGFTQGGFLNGTLASDDEIGLDFLRPMTASFGITALNELSILHNGQTITEDNAFATEVMTYINKEVERFKKEDNWMYAVYGTPAESLVSLQVTQFRTLFGEIKDVSDRLYMSNSFHCNVREDITPFEKQDKERELWDLFNGGKIQYTKYPINYNLGAIETIVRRGMQFGFYQGVNLSLSYCQSCGYEALNLNECPKCQSSDIVKIDRMNGYLSYSRVKNDSRLNEGKMAEIADRVSM